MNYCHHCGKRVSKGHLVCSNCGTYLRRRGHKTNYLAIIIRAALIIALVWFFLYLFNKYS